MVYMYVYGVYGDLPYTLMGSRSARERQNLVRQSEFQTIQTSIPGLGTFVICEVQ